MLMHRGVVVPWAQALITGHRVTDMNVHLKRLRLDDGQCPPTPRTVLRKRQLIVLRA